MHTIFLLIGKSGCGKSTLADMLSSYGYSQLPSFTTRPMREGEVNGKDHTFITNEMFHHMYSNGQIAASTYFNGNYYGASKRDILNYDVYIIDKAGLVELKETMQGKVNIIAIYINASMSQLINRMRLRGESYKKIMSRVCNDIKMFQGVKEMCDFTVDNTSDNVLTAYHEILKIMNSLQ